MTKPYKGVTCADGMQGSVPTQAFVDNVDALMDGLGASAKCKSRSAFMLASPLSARAQEPAGPGGCCDGSPVSAHRSRTGRRDRAIESPREKNTPVITNATQTNLV